MKTTKIVIVGAGSPGFAANMLADMFACPEFRGSSLGLVDTDGKALELVAAFARRANDERNFKLSIEASIQRKDLLPGADFVISAIGVATMKCWQQEWEICQKHGIHHAWCGLTGPAGLARTLRMAPPTLEICRDMEALCPNAWLFNYANPVSRLGWAIARYTRIKAVGLCHAYYGAKRRLAGILEVPEEKLDAKAAGLNHFSFFYELKLRESGEDLYPRLRKKLEADPSPDQPLSASTLRWLGFYPLPDDMEVGDYLGYCHSKSFRSWEKYNLKPYDWEGGGKNRDRYWKDMTKALQDRERLDRMLKPSGEKAIEMARAIVEDRDEYFPAVNIANQGFIANLKTGGLVEVSARAGSAGVRGINVGISPGP